MTHAQCSGERLGSERSETAVLEVECCRGQAVDDPLYTVDVQLFTRCCVHILAVAVIGILSSSSSSSSSCRLGVPCSSCCPRRQLLAGLCVRTMRRKVKVKVKFIAVRSKAYSLKLSLI